MVFWFAINIKELTLSQVYCIINTLPKIFSNISCDSIDCKPPETGADVVTDVGTDE